MNTGLLVSLMLACGIMIGCTPFLCFTIANIAFGIQGIPTNLLLITLLITVSLNFILSAASFAYLQYSSCKKIKNGKQILTNAGIAAGLQFVTLLFVYFTGFTSIPINMLPPWLLAQFSAKEGIGYGYYSLFASMFGTVLGGTLSAIC
jgi:hypothetical protein